MPLCKRSNSASPGSLARRSARRATLDLPLSDDRRAKVLAAARAKEWFENWVTKRLADDGDAEDRIALLR